MHSEHKEHNKHNKAKRVVSFGYRLRYGGYRICKDSYCGVVANERSGGDNMHAYTTSPLARTQHTRNEEQNGTHVNRVGVFRHNRWHLRLAILLAILRFEVL